MVDKVANTRLCNLTICIPRHDALDWDDWGDDSPPVASTPRVAPAPVSAPAPAISNPRPTAITSLGTRQASAKKKPEPKPKPQEDDIFASMGLAAKPTFTSPAGRITRTPATAPASSGLAEAAAEVNEDPGADWGDDSDLDDLLDD